MGESNPLSEEFMQGVELHRQGRFDEAAAIYRQVLSKSPGDFDATHMLGVIALQQGRFPAAQEAIGAALAVRPDDIAAVGNLGTSYLRAGQFESAYRWFARALELQPDSSVSLTNVGTILHHLGRPLEAIPLLRRALSLEPASYETCKILGACLLDNGNAAEAIGLFETATQLRPDNTEAWISFSSALSAIGEHEKAAGAARRAIALDPESSAAFGALGAVHVKQERTTDAIEAYRTAAALPEPSLGLLLGFSNLLLGSGLHDEAIANLQRALQLDPQNLPVRWTLAVARLKPVYQSEAEMVESRGAFSQAIDELSMLDRSTTKATDVCDAVGVSQPFYVAYQPFNNRDLLTQYGELCATWMSALPREATPRDPGATSRKIRLGIVSAHIHEHSVWNAITRGWVYNLDLATFELVIFQLNPSRDKETDKARRFATALVDQPTNLSDWVRAILDADLDVLIYPDIGMDALTLRLAALRLAKVQAASWGHPETTGLPTLDYYISAAAFESEDAQDNYSETLIRLPNLGVHVEPLKPSISKPGLSALKLPTDEPLLLCPGSPFKYTPIYDEVWVEIARRLPKKSFKRGSGGRLVFFRSRSESMDRLLEQRLRAAFERQSLDFDAHVSIVPNLDRSRFFGLMRESALLLDTPGFSGFNTALQAIECGLPVLAFEGKFMRGRLASGIMRRLELPELVATTPEDFVTKTLELLANAPRRKSFAASIVKRRHILFGDLEPVRALERELAAAVIRARPPD
jgi:predicted O-linked N-acetylglucosamine transferase (SPINDLY family)